jgi:hypothetical protein
MRSSTSEEQPVAFEVFKKRMVPLTGAPYATIQKRGTVSLNKAAHHLLGSPEAIELLYDAESRVIGFRTVETSVEHAYTVRSMGGASRSDTAATTYMISGTAFFNYYEIDTSEARRYPVELVDGILCLDLKREGTVVTSNRLGRAKERTPGRSFGRAGRDNTLP